MTALELLTLSLVTLAGAWALVAAAGMAVAR
jgi:hypothetical protein